jgi:hypothetical protein
MLPCELQGSLAEPACANGARATSLTSESDGRKGHGLARRALVALPVAATCANLASETVRAESLSRISREQRDSLDRPVARRDQP